MDPMEAEQTPFAAVTAQTSKLQRVLPHGRPTPVKRLRLTSTLFLQRYQALLDQSTPFVLYRWVGTGVGLLVFFLRVFMAQGWYIGMAAKSWSNPGWNIQMANK